MSHTPKAEALKVVFVGKRKEAVARLKVVKGSGKVLVNGVPIELWGNWIAREKAMVPLRIAEGVRSSHDFHLNVHGGGTLGQADAIAIAIARAVATLNPEYGKMIESFDYHLLSGDPRRTEPKKPNRRSARRFKQKSYR
ncbi:MAG: 30S ribosomal protein S9 [Thaumarchaeota archaeon]|nr:30S ribosomal protein S9 [Candidatus Calditenuaceae archaeon]MDW8186861.1 30S ribosomal protein S9 [Nitrososphaerota archaeon]